MACKLFAYSRTNSQYDPEWDPNAFPGRYGVADRRGVYRKEIVPLG